MFLISLGLIQININIGDHWFLMLNYIINYMNFVLKSIKLFPVAPSGGPQL